MSWWLVVSHIVAFLIGAFAAARYLERGSKP